MKKIIKSIYMVIVHGWILLKAKSIGNNCFIGRRASINKPQYLTLHDNVHIGHDARLGFFDHFFDQELKPELIIGKRVYIVNHFTALCADKIVIEDDVLIASYVMITSENHGIDPESETTYGKQPLVTKPVRVCKGAWIGEKVSVLPGVTIGERSIIGAGSVVTRDIPPYSMAAGVPAKVIKKYDFETHSWKKLDEEKILLVEKNETLKKEMGFDALENAKVEI